MGELKIFCRRKAVSDIQHGSRLGDHQIAAIHRWMRFVHTA
ncbi:MAG: hypothetical protein ACJAVR_001601 [Paracoccaceae bacterium]|jgi:hypothetical protein